MASRKIVNDRAQQHVQQPALNFTAAILPRTRGQANFANFLAAVGTPVEPRVHRLAAVSTRTGKDRLGLRRIHIFSLSLRFTSVKRIPRLTFH